MFESQDSGRKEKEKAGTHGNKESGKDCREIRMKKKRKIDNKKRKNDARSLLFTFKTLYICFDFQGISV